MIDSGAVILRVDDLETAQRFYVDVLGFRLLAPRIGHGIAVALEGLTVLLMPRSTDQRRPEGDAFGWMGLALTVSDMSAARRTLEARGIVFEGEVVDLPVGKVAFFYDPDGYTLGLVERA